MNIHSIALATIISIAASGSAFASNLNDEQIKEVISNKKVVLKTTWGAFPLRYDANKRVTGDGSGVGLARFFTPKETGSWWVASNKLCQKFPTWYDGQTFCFSLQKAGGNKLRWRRDDGYSGTALVQR